MEKVKTFAITTIERRAANYPQLLAEIGDPPERLFVRGQAGVLSKTLLAIVGTRHCTDEGVAFCRLLVEQLNRVPELVTVSGLAFGIDAAVHQTAVSASRPTIAVLASGVDSPTPTSHSRLAHEILVNGGCLVSEYPPGTPAEKFRFPERNRIIAGLSQATLVIEAGQPSGALITAYQALDMNRDVLAVPGSPFNAAAAGTNALIKRGAVPVTEAGDVLRVLGLEHAPAAESAAADPEHERVLRQLSQPQTLDQLAEACTIPIQRLNGLLSVLELQGAIRRLPDQRIVRSRWPLQSITRGKITRHC